VPSPTLIVDFVEFLRQQAVDAASHSGALGVNPRCLHVRFVVNEATPEQGFSDFLWPASANHRSADTYLTRSPEL
jgi:hypothetical protein